MNALASLGGGAIAFVGSHLLLSHPLRGAVAGRIGEQRFTLLYSVVALLTFGWFVASAVAAPPEPLYWVAGQGVWDLATIVMLLASVLLVGSLIGNPAMVDPTLKPAIPERPRGVLAVTRHPMMWSFTLWAAVHAVLWGSAANLIVAVAVGTLAFVGSRGQDAKKARLLGDGWRNYQAVTSFWPFGAQVTGRASWGQAMPRWPVLLGGVALWLVATYLHPLAGGPVAGPWRWLP